MSYESIITNDNNCVYLDEQRVALDFFKKRKLGDQEDESESEDSSNKKARRTCWSRPITEKLLELVKANQGKLQDKFAKKKNVWSAIWLELYSLDKGITIEQVEKKWRNMVQTYKKYIEHKKKDSNVSMKKPEFFNVMDTIIGDSFCGFDDEPETLKVRSTRSLQKILNLEESFSESQLIQEMEVQEEPAASSQIKPETHKKRHRLRPPTRTESVENSIQQLVETNREALEVDKDRLKFLEEQVVQQNKFDAEFLKAFKERNDIIKRNAKVFQEFKEMFHAHLKLFKEIDLSTKRMAKFMEEKFNAESE